MVWRLVVSKLKTPFLEWSFGVITLRFEQPRFRVRKSNFIKFSGEHAGFEPRTPSLKGMCSAAELRSH